MNYRTNILAAGLLLTAWRPIAMAARTPAPDAKTPREIFICVSDTAPESIRTAAKAIADRPNDYPLLHALAATHGVTKVELQSSEALLKKPTSAAYNHLVVIGLPGTDALLDKVWEHYAAVDSSAKTLYAQGWGYLTGDLGYIESDRNPFLHSHDIDSAPFETEIVKISGTSERGVSAAIHAFHNGLLNGIVPAGQFARPQTTVLDLDPLVTPTPLRLPNTDAPLAGWTQVPANEYRAYADQGGSEPVHVWRYKYLPADALDDGSIRGWLNGFQRMSWGNAVTIAEMPSADEATKTARAIGGSHGFVKTVMNGITLWTARQPMIPLNPKGGGWEDEQLPNNPPGTMTCAAVGKFVILSSLDPTEVAKICEANR